MQAIMKTLLFPDRIKSIGFEDSRDDYEKRKLRIFNVLNVIDFLIRIFLPIISLSITNIDLPTFA